jgi:drug/metabolite transporter (DMT)-like permease
MLVATGARARDVGGLNAIAPIALLAVWLFWGGTYLAVRFAVETLPPMGMAGVRFVVAGAILFAIARWRGEPWPARSSWGASAAVGALLFLVGNGSVVLAIRASLQSSLAAVVCATTPLVAAAMLALGRRSTPSRREIAGMVLGLAGVAVLATRSPLAHASPRALVILLAPLGWSAGSLIARAEKNGGLAHAAAQMACGGVFMTFASVVMGERFPEALAFRSVAAWVWLIIFGSILGFSAYAWLLKNTRPAVALSYAYVNPIVAALLGVAIGGEALTGATLGATALIASGVMAVVLQSKV